MSRSAHALVVREQVPLAPLTTFRVGGPARWYARATCAEHIEEGIAWAATHQVPLLLLGGGSNLLVADAGFPGLVLHMALSGVRAEHGLIEAAAGEEWDPLVALAVERGWAGIECLSGIPGRVGATPIQNVGAYGQEVAGTIVEVDVLDRVESRRRTIAAADGGFGYRDSRFKSAEPERFVVLAVRYALAPGGAPKIAYAELARALAGRGATTPSLADVRETVLALRRGKGMVLDDADADTRSAGSFFVNPVLGGAEYTELLERARGEALVEANAEPPHFPAPGGNTKLPAAWLIERAGFHKGLKRGRAGLSSKHTLAVINRGGASAEEIRALAREIRDGVEGRFGVRLLPEPNFVGFAVPGL